MYLEFFNLNLILAREIIYQLIEKFYFHLVLIPLQFKLSHLILYLLIMLNCEEENPFLKMIDFKIFYPYLKLLYFFLKNFRQIFFLIEILFFID